MPVEKLKGEHRQKLCTAILDAFPNSGKLEQVIDFGLDQNLDAIATGGDYSEVIYKLLKWAESEGKLQQLMDALRHRDYGNPGNPQLKSVCQKLQQSQPVGEHFYNLINPCNFDLSTLIDKCLDEVYEQRGLVGIVLPCDDDAFQANFCQRLKQELGKSNMQIKRALALNPRMTSVETAINIIKRYKNSLAYTDILCPVRVNVRDSAIINEFWQKISIEFEEDFKHCLIIILLGNEDCNFPQFLIQLEPPKFKQTHVHQWIVKLSRNLGWEEKIVNQWKQRMIAECCVDSLENQPLNIRYVYDYLDDTRKLFQEMKDNLSPEAFLEELEQIMNFYV